MKVFCIGLAITLSLLSRAFVCVMTAQVLPLHQYTPKDGLIAGEVNTMFQDSRGFLWAGTAEGLSMYDGTSFTNFTTTDGLAANYINCITESRREPGTLLIGTHGGGISRFVPGRRGGKSRGTFETITIDSSLYSQRVGRILEDTAGRLWVGTSAGVYTVRKGTVELFMTYGPHDGADMISSSDGTILLGVGKSLYRIDPLTLARDSQRIAIPGEEIIRHLLLDRESRLWIVTNRNLLLGYSGSVLLGSRRIPDGLVNMMLDDSRGNLWLCTRSGLLSIPASAALTAIFIRYGEDNGLPSNFVPFALFDREQNMWIGGHLKGVAKWADKSLLSFPFPVPHIYNNAATVVDANGHFWIAGADALHEVWREDGRWFHHRHQPGTTIQSIHRDREGRLWVDEFDRGIHCYEVLPRTGKPSTLKTVRQIALLQKEGLRARHCFIVDRSGLLWSSVGGVGIVVVDPFPIEREVRRYTPEDGLPGVSVRVIFEDGMERIWLAGFNEGVAVAPRGASGPLVRPRHLESRIPEGGVRSITEDHRGRIWLGTRYGGIVVQSADSVSAITLADGLISNAVWCQSVDAEGNLWLGTQRGLQRIDGTSLRPELMRQEFTGELVLSCGVTPAFVWFTTRGGLSLFEPHQSRVLPPPPVYITSFEVNSRPMLLDDRQEFDHNENNCTIAFVGLSFRDETALRYTYRLSGVEGEWQEPTPQGKVTYASLRPGDYAFEVRAVTADGMRSDPPARLSFTITAPFWDTWWFRALLIVFIPLTVALVVFRRFSTLRRETNQQREFSARLIAAQDAERGRIAAELHDGLGQSLVLIQHGLQHSMIKAQGDDSVKEELQKTIRIAADTVHEVREISSTLHPQVLDKLGLTRAISSVVQKVTEMSRLRVNLDLDDLDGALAKEEEIHVYRIVQEALNNVLKHSGASEADLHVKRMTDALTITVRDNGKGVDGADRKPPGRQKDGFGLAGIAERTRILRGTFSIKTERDSGFLLSLHIPLSADEKRT